MDSANPGLSPDTKLDHFRQTRVTPRSPKCMDYSKMTARDSFSHGARFRARVGFGSSGSTQKALLLLVPTTPTLSTSFNSFLNPLSSESVPYPILNPASWMENPIFCPGGTFIEGTQPLARNGFGWTNFFLEAYSLLFPMMPTEFTSFNSFPSYSTFHRLLLMDHYW